MLQVARLKKQVEGAKEKSKDEPGPSKKSKAEEREEKPKKDEIPPYTSKK